METLWKPIWTLKCPNKIRNFIWRAWKDVLLIKTILRDQHIPIKLQCEYYGPIETPCHAFQDCDIASDAWIFLNLNLPNLAEPPKSFLDLFQLVKYKLKNVNLELFATMVWGLWNNKNKIKHEGQCKIATAIVNEASQYLEEFQQAQASYLSSR